jgi:hypothetical protein
VTIPFLRLTYIITSSITSSGVCPGSPAQAGTDGANKTFGYNYNEIGNMICNPELGPCSGATPNYSYPASGPGSVRPHAVTQAGSNTYDYDLNGNMILGAGRLIDYDRENRPAKITVGASITNFVYDADGTRVKKVSGSVTTP